MHQQRDANDEWKKIKNSPDAYQAKLLELQDLKKRNEAQSCLFWTGLSKKVKDTPSDAEGPNIKQESQTDSKAVVAEVNQPKTNEINILNEEKKETIKYAQDNLNTKIAKQKSLILKLQDLKESGLATNDNFIQLKKAKECLSEDEKRLIILQKDADKKRKRRAALRETMKDLSDSNPKLKKFARDRTGRPSLEKTQSDLHNAIIALVTHGAGADRKRRTEILNACCTLDDLVSEHRKMDNHLSRSALYLSLIPRRIDSNEGKKHVNVVPVKLRRPENSQHKHHVDADFTFATKEYLKAIAALFGPSAVFVLSIDDKAKVPLGVAAASKQAPILMCLEYEVRLPDHDFVIAGRHRLTPSVYAACIIKVPSEYASLEISYSGPLYIAIRSAKHDGSTSFTHGRDVEYLLELESFQEVAKNNGVVKPIFMAFVDGGPDENPRFPKTLAVAVHQFKKYNLDIYITMTNAPGLSAFNYVERRMAPLSKELAGIILPHDSYGNHLNATGCTIDENLEKQNFKKVGEVLSELWRNMTLDGHPVEAEYVENATLSVEDVDEGWITRHCRISQYMLMIVKCQSVKCCSKMRSNWLEAFPNRFLPAPFPVRTTSSGPYIPDPSDVKTGDKFMQLWQRLAIKVKPASSKSYKGEMPYDSYCPSLTPKDIASRVCNSCQIYMPSHAAIMRHRNGGCSGTCQGKLTDVEDETETECLETTESHSSSSGSPAVYRNIFDIFKSPWEDE